MRLVVLLALAKGLSAKGLSAKEAFTIPVSDVTYPTVSRFYPSVGETVVWGNVCPYHGKALSYSIPMNPAFLPNTSIGYDFGLACDLPRARLGYLAQPDPGGLTLEQQIAQHPLPSVGCTEADDPVWARRLIPLWLIVVVYCFYHMAVTCDEYLVPSLNILCERYNIPEDVAGATLMAAGCNGPEFFAVISSTFIQPSTVGPGAILGSCPFNLMVILAAVSFGVAGNLRPDPWLIGREIVCLCIALMAFILVVRDSVVWWWEALILVGLYVLYVFASVYTRQIIGWFKATVGLSSAKVEPSAKPNLQVLTHIAAANEHAARGGSVGVTRRRTSSSVQIQPGVKHEPFYAFPKTALGWLPYVLTVWMKALLHFTIPDPHNPKTMKYYGPTLVISVIWLAAQAYIMTICLNYIGCAAGISQLVMGNTLGAIGTSFPNMVASIITARQGHADMALCQAIGANTFNVLIALGFLWFIQAIAGQCQYGNRSMTKEWCQGCFMPMGFQNSCPAGPNTPNWNSVGSLIGTCLTVYSNLALVVISLLAFRGKIPIPAAVIMLIWYVLWLIYQILASYNYIPVIQVAWGITI